LGWGLEVTGVSKSFGSVSVLQNVTFHLEEGKIGTIVGPSGAGKTSLLNIIAGLYSADEGSVEIGGRLVERGGSAPVHLKPVERNVGYVFQDYVLFPHMTVYENIAFGLRARHIPESSVTERVKTIIEKVGIGDLSTRKPSQISGGQTQRVAVARALVLEPQLLLLDEPLSALDVRTREAVRLELRRVYDELGTTVVHVTHDLDEAFFLGQRIGIILPRRLMFFGSKNDLFDSISRETAVFLGFNLIAVEPRRVEGDEHVLFVPEWNAEIRVHIFNSPKSSGGLATTLAVPPEFIRIAPPNQTNGARNMLVTDVLEFKDGVRLMLEDSGRGLVAEIPSLDFRRLGVERGESVGTLLAGGFLLTE